MKFQYRVATAIASSALVFNMLAPVAFADTTVTVSGNGKKSNNTVNVTKKSNTTVNQSNNMTVILGISSTASTGGNKANGNTGGDVSIETGNASTNTTVNITGGSNNATVNSCGCDEGDTTVDVTGNGKKSDNYVKVKDTHDVTANQGGNLGVIAGIHSKAKTGKNKANDNTNGTVDVTTGNSNTTTNATVTSGDNSLEI